MRTRNHAHPQAPVQASLLVSMKEQPSRQNPAQLRTARAKAAMGIAKGASMKGLLKASRHPPSSTPSQDYHLGIETHEGQALLDERTPGRDEFSRQRTGDAPLDRVPRKQGVARTKFIG